MPAVTASRAPQAARLAVYVAVFALVWQLNRMTDFTADDFIYHFVFQVGPPDSAACSPRRSSMS